MVADALGWIVRNLEEFDPFKDGRPFEFKHGQKVGELAILLHAYASLSGDHNSEPVQRILSLLVSIQKNPAFTDRLLRSPKEFILFAEVYASLRSCGHDDLDQRELIQRVIDARFFDHSERLPHRAMDIVSCLEWGDFRHPLPSLESLYDSSILGRLPNAGFLDEDAVYFLTHVIMFLYSFGTRTDISVPPDQREGLESLLSNLLIAHCEEHHWDLLAEVLLCWDCIGFPPTFVSARAWEELLKIQRDDGAIPGPEWAEKLRQSQKIDESGSAEVYFDHHYHTTLVSIVAGCVHLKRLASLPAPGPTTVDTIQDERAEPQQTPDLQPLHPGAPSLDELRSISRARQWLDDLSGTLLESETVRPEVLSKILLGHWVCDSRTANAGRAFRESAVRIGEALTLAEANDRVDWSKTAPALKLMVGALLSSQEVFVPFLHSRDGFLRLATEAMNATPATEPFADMPLSEKRVLLHAMALHPPPIRIEFSEVKTFARGLSLSEPGSAIEELLLRIHSHTSFGTVRANVKHSDRWIPELLAGLAITYFRKYDLLTGSRILRALCYLGAPAESLAPGIGFLKVHQRPDGAFGFFGIESYELRDKVPDRLALDIELSLPVTIECLWTLAEASNANWRLYQTFPHWIQGIWK